MSTIWIILAGAGGGLLLLVVFAIIFTVLSNKKSASSLQKSIDKYKGEIALANERDPSILISPEVPEKPAAEQADTQQAQPMQTQTDSLQPHESMPRQSRPIVEPYDDEQSVSAEKVSPSYAKAQAKKAMLAQQHQRERQQRHDDFEEFLDEHAYSRRIINKDILSTLQELPPDVKAVLISGLFNKPED